MAAAAAARATTTIKAVLLPFKALLCKDIVVTAKASGMIHFASPTHHHYHLSPPPPGCLLGFFKLLHLPLC